MSTQQSIAIIGAGISGLGSAYLLQSKYDITLFERNEYLGGHSRTIDVYGDMPVDTGFIVFNDWNYPNLFGLFNALKVPYEKSDMSFGVSIKGGMLEYSSNSLFAQKRNILRPQFYTMLRDILRFNKQALTLVEHNPDITLQECLDQLNLGEWFQNYYILAMGAAIWSCPIKTIMEFPAATFLRFFKNHGLLNVKKRPQWYTVSGGSREYVRRLRDALNGNIQTSAAAQTVSQKDDKWLVIDKNGKQHLFDKVIFACHADEALALIDAPSAAEHDVLSAFRYQENTIITHADDSFMPKSKGCWASWIYLSDQTYDDKPSVSLSYWMNNLQNLPQDKPVFVTLNPDRRPDENLIMDEHTFSHPIFDQKAITAQDKIPSIQGQRGLWFCGAYQRYGFHEDGLLSAVHVAKDLGVSIPWEA